MTKMRGTIGAWTCAFALTIAARPVSAQAFRGLGLPDGLAPSSEASGVSADGSTVAVTTATATSHQAARWTAGGGLQELGTLPYPGIGVSDAYGISGDGRTIVGSSLSTTSSTPAVQAMRHVNGSMQGLGDLPGGVFSSGARAVNANGSVIVGYGSGNGQFATAARWANGSIQPLGDLPGGNVSSDARGVSGDGTIVVGSSNSANGDEAFRWTAGGGMQGLGDLPGGVFSSMAYAISADGSTIVGKGATEGQGYQAFRYTTGGGMVALGDLPFGSEYSVAYAVSADGSVIVGSGEGPNFTDQATLWDAGGIHKIQDILVNDYGLNLAGWELTRATGISADGRTIVGTGKHSFITEAWIATIPEPGTAAGLVVAGLFALTRRRDKKRSVSPSAA